MRVLLINAPYPLAEFPILHLGLTYLAAVLENEGVEVQILDLLVTRYSPEKIERKIQEFRPQICGTSCVTMNYHMGSEILRVCKEVDPSITTIIGGPHVSFAVEEALQEAGWIDLVVKKEGERTLLELVSVLGRRGDLRDVKGIGFRLNGQIVMTEERPFIEDLDELPLPARRLLPLSRYRALRSGCSVITSRGCPFNCIFCCGSRMIGRRARLRSPEKVVDEIEFVCKNLGFSQILIEDDLFTVNHRHVYEICDEIIKRGLGVDWRAFARVDTVDRPLLERMREAGCSWICYGVESGNQEILDMAKKKVTLAQTREAVELTKEVGIEALASFIIGLPGETKETLAETIRFAKDLGCRYGFHVLAPFPGTEVRELAESFGLRILTDDWQRYDANQAVAETSGASARDLNDVAERYNEDVAVYLEYQREAASAGKLNKKELAELQERDSRDFVWQLLKKDVIERLGRTELMDYPPRVNDCTQKLSRKIAKELAQPLDFVGRELGRLIRDGELVYELNEQGGKHYLIWKWKD